MSTNAEALAAWLVEQHQDKAAIAAMPDAIAAQSRAEAIEAQEALFGSSQ